MTRSESLGRLLPVWWWGAACLAAACAGTTDVTAVSHSAGAVTRAALAATRGESLVFKGGQLELRVDVLGATFSGTLVIGGVPCAVRGSVEDYHWSGEFQHLNTWHAFEADRDGTELQLTSGGSEYALVLESSEQPANPLARPGSGSAHTGNPLAHVARREQTPSASATAGAGLTTPRSEERSPNEELLPQVVTHASGLRVRIPAEWIGQDGGANLVIQPPATTLGAPPFNLQVEAQPWTGGTQRLGHPDVLGQIESQFAAALPDFNREQPTQVLQINGIEVIVQRFAGRAGDGSIVRVWVAAKIDRDRLITQALVGNAREVSAVHEVAMLVFGTATVDPGGLSSAGPLLRQVLAVPGSGFVMSYHESWLPQIAGVSAAFLIPGADGTISPSESCVVGVIPWQAGFSIRVPEAVNVLSLMVNQLIPGLVVDGAIQPLAVNEGEGLLLRFAPGPGVTNVPCRAWLLARSSDTALVVIIATASPTTPTDRESVLRAMAQSVRFTGESIQSTQAAWGPGLAPGQGTPSPRGASPAPGSAGALDPNLVGTWVSETAMSSPAPWSDLGQGGTSLAFLTVYVFGPDGNYALGSQAAGGNGDIGMDTGFSLSARGRWMVTQAPDEKGVLRTFILLTDQFGRQNQVRYTFHNGQLVLGGEGQRSFWSRR